MDDFELYTVLHHHGHGVDSFIWRVEKGLSLTQLDVIKTLSQWEGEGSDDPREDESIEIILVGSSEILTLSRMTAEPQSPPIDNQEKTIAEGPATPQKLKARLTLDIEYSTTDVTCEKFILISINRAVVFGMAEGQFLADGLGPDVKIDSYEFSSKLV